MGIYEITPCVIGANWPIELYVGYDGESAKLDVGYNGLSTE